MTAPKLLRTAKPEYTASAIEARLSGEVHLEVVVGTDGRITEARVVRSLDRVHGLDEQALKAVDGFRFQPATRDGLPVQVVVRIVLEFNLGKRPPQLR